MSSTSKSYGQDIDFVALGDHDADFARFLKANGQLDFSDPKAVQQLTISLLKRDFNLSLTLPDDRLCPPVPNRLNYISWIQQLLDTSSESYNDTYDAGREIVGIDIGTGASCIYPLLGCSRRPTWKFVGTDIDEKSLQFARQNVEANKLHDRIKLLSTSQESFFDKIPFDNIQVDFTMCNPPFYASTGEMVTSAESKQRPPFSACTGSASEMVTPGGEVQFVSRMIEESMRVRDGCQWFSSMVGKLSSLTPLIEKLRKHDISNYAVTEFVQGTKTRRWAVAWSFEDLRPSIAVSRGTTALAKALLPFPSAFVHEFHLSINESSEHINKIMSSLPMNWLWKDVIKSGLGLSDGVVWSRAARRKALKAGHAKQSGTDELSFGIKVIVGGLEPGAGSQITIRWVKGHDSVVFESFCGMVVKRLADL